MHSTRNITHSNKRFSTLCTFRLGWGSTTPNRRERRRSTNTKTDGAFSPTIHACSWNTLWFRSEGVSRSYASQGWLHANGEALSRGLHTRRNRLEVHLRHRSLWRQSDAEVTEEIATRFRNLRKVVQPKQPRGETPMWVALREEGADLEVVTTLSFKLLANTGFLMDRWA